MPPSRTGGSPLELTVDQRALTDLAAAMRKESDGKELRKALTKNLRAAAAPLVVDLRAAVRAIPSAGAGGHTPALREAVARGIASNIRYTGKATGIRVYAKSTPQVRGFTHAARRLNRPSWRHPVYGNTSVWVTQVGDPRWFDDPIMWHREHVRRKAVEAIDELARTLASRVR